MSKVITTTAFAALLSMIVTSPVLADPKGEATVTYLGNSDNVAEPGQGGEGATQETTTGPKGRVENENNPDLGCNNCETSPRDKPGKDR